MQSSNKRPSLPRIAITTGDPAGVGPEICLKILTDQRVLDVCVPVLLGDRALLERVGKKLGLAVPSQVIGLKDSLTELDRPTLIDFAQSSLSEIEPGRVAAPCGAAAFEYIEHSIRLALQGDVAAVVTAPINKEALHQAGIDYPGHTEIFFEKSGADRYCMMLTAEKITAALVTTHVGYDEVPKLLSIEKILETITLAADAMHRLRGKTPKLTVCGLNPHAGEHGLFGHGEEEKLIGPAIELARQQGIDIEGPLPPDTAFLPGRLTTTDAHICMYHDQGLIPLKMLAFDTAVNVTLGLPIVRTSPDHGTAMDIAMTGKANPESLVQAVLTAVRLADQ
jgi:4-hydroxythreonine-4-phosphate dehydrogenase